MATMTDAEKAPVQVTQPPTEDSAPQRGSITGKVGFWKRSFVNDPNELGRDLLTKALEFDEAQLERDAIKVRRKLDFMVLPMMMTTYMLSFLDKQT